MAGRRPRARELAQAAAQRPFGALTHPDFDPEPLIEALAGHGWYTGCSVLPPAIEAGLRAWLARAAARAALRPAGTGRGAEARLRSDLRRDEVLWLDADQADEDVAAGAPIPQALACLDALRRLIGQRLLLALHDGEFHLARYAPGAFYRRHRDRFSDDDARVLSVVCYLNEDWSPAAGGELVLYANDEGDDELVRIEPRSGTMAVFLSAVFPHEVLPATRERLALTGWLRQRPLGPTGVLR